MFQPEMVSAPAVGMMVFPQPALAITTGTLDDLAFYIAVQKIRLQPMHDSPLD
jgi:hypothetical protein